ncbi:MAG: redoxin domain-containing protein [Hyphomonadaceae bacterium]
MSDTRKSGDMKARWFAGVAAVGIATALAATYVSAVATPDATATLVRVDNFELSDQDYFAHQLYRLKDAKAVALLAYASGDSEIARDASKLMALKAAYESQGVAFLALASRSGDTREKVASDMSKIGLDVPVLFDYDQFVAEQLKVANAGEVFVINPKGWTVAYRGPVAGAKGEAWAKDAIMAVSEGRSVGTAIRPAKGGAITIAARSQDISYAKTIAPIIQAKCTTCHQPGGVGPMPLNTYEQVQAFAPMIREAIRTQRMPPSAADAAVGHFKDDIRLTSDQRKSLVHWVEAGAPRGVGEDPLAKLKFQAPEWAMGKPDLIAEFPEAKVNASGLMPYQYPSKDNVFSEGRWLKAVSFRYSDRQAVHHTIARAVSSTKADKTKETNEDLMLPGYVPGRPDNPVADDSGTFIPANSALSLQQHYQPYGKESNVTTQIGFYFYPKGEAPKYVSRAYGILDFNIEIPAGDAHHQEMAYIAFPEDALLLGLTPHAHARGASSKVSIEYPDGKEQLLLALPRYDFNWQHTYYLDKPISIPAGSKIISRWIYDNSTGNPSNPDPKRTVPWGEQTTEEMLANYVHYRWVGETAQNPREDYEKELKAGMMMGVLDTSLDGKLQPAELSGPVGKRIGAAMAMLDTDKDGALSQNEINVAMKGIKLFGGGSTETPPPAPAKN